MLRFTRLKRVVVVAGGFCAFIAIVGLLLDALFPPYMGRLRDHSTLVLASDNSVLRAFATADGAWRFPTEVSAVDPKFIKYLKTFEDQRFDWHPGIDPMAIVRAGYQALSTGKVVSGASTLSMQTARLLEPRRRNLEAKLIESWRALQLTWHLGAKGVLDVYLTLAPYGGNLEGVRAASLGYFGKEPRHLTEAEAALLVALPQSPERLRPDRFPKAAERARNKVLTRLLEKGVIDQATYQMALGEAVPSRRLSALSDAPHLAERLRLAMPGEVVIRTTIDHELQRYLQDLLIRRSANLEAGATISALVVGNKDRRVLAYLGSANYFDQRQFGPIDMVRAIRSPGSTLKPFVYGMAFDELIIHPETLMVDQPMRFGEWAPENFDNLFRGDVSAREALQLSLNLPAVVLMDAVGAPPFAQKLADSGFPLHLPKDAGMPGLPIILGGVGVSLEQMVAMYAGFSEQGTVRALRFLRDQPIADPKPLIGKVGSYYVTRILEDTPPPNNWLASGNRRQSSRIAYKTGTSYGYRDAWAVGYTHDYTIGIWVGRPDGSFSGGRMGRDAAAPLLFEAFDRLPLSESALPRTPPKEVLQVNNQSLPVNLRRYQNGPALGIAHSLENRLRIAFPLDGSTVPATQNEIMPALVLKAEGGNLPLRWLVNGKPVSSLPYLRQAQWDPDGRGSQRVTVIDSTGHSASAEVWLK